MNKIPGFCNPFMTTETNCFTIMQNNIIKEYGDDLYNKIFHNQVNPDFINIEKKF